MKKRTLLLCGAWLLFLACLFMVEYRDSAATHKELIFNTARTLVDQIFISREWNAEHGGVYMPVTKETPSNPYLDDPNKDIRINKKLTLTKVNPAYMTRQMAELTARRGDVQIHITSLKPVRPENSPNSREEKALEAFETGAQEFGEIIGRGRDMKFFYMAPLKTEKDCLQCHAKQGYKEGDVRGGISIIMPVHHKDHLMGLIAGHVAIGLIGLFGIFLFSLKLEKSYEIIERLAVVDALTGIPNHRAFLERMPMEFKRRTRSNKPLSFIMADIDHFKIYNDTYGHAAGDDCLRRVAQAIRDTIKRSSDFCARYGGEEFVLLLPDTTREDALSVAERIRTAVEGIKIPNERAMPFGIVTLSLGVATAGSDSADSYEETLRHADKALYSAKDKGRNRVEVADA